MEHFNLQGKKWWVLGAIFIVLLLEFLLFMDRPFFWDALTKAQRANWLYTHDFSQLVVPTDLNSGHPPLWIGGIALFWTIFGKALWSARLLLLLVNLGVCYQLWIMLCRFFGKEVPWWLMLLVFIEPTFLAQTTSLNNDMLLLFFTLLGLNSLLANKWNWYALALSGILLTNLRGIYIFIALTVLHVILVRKDLLVYQSKMLRGYLIGLFVFLMFLIYQYVILGWVIITPNPHYSGHREAVPVRSVLKNTVVFIKSILENGRLLVWIPLFLLLWRSFRRKTVLSASIRSLLLVLSVFLVVFFLGFVPFSNPIGPRYLMVCYLLAGVLFIKLLYELPVKGYLRKGLLVAMVIGYVSGHFWIYPPTIAQAWDSSLAYVRYDAVEEDMLEYISKKNIPVSEIGSQLRMNFRKIAAADASDVKDLYFATPNLDVNPYYLFSNIENATSDEEIRELQQHWEVIKNIDHCGVFITLYKNPEF
ncbi:glycosyltransferase family 39 protein [Altibacter lentus]|uniref:glycosyltransferase family 39 protein n=1 Tax=Altibacter lentus TaxID=1223410 RepID=UPI00054E7A4A|nr:glycosyltransferase family 39 protein [Altibacter lentus]